MYRLSEFSGLTVITLLVQIVFIFIEQYINFIRPLPSNTSIVVTNPKTPTTMDHLHYATYQSNNYALLYRFLFHIFQLLLIHGMVFWYFPNGAGVRINGNPECTRGDIQTGKCNEVPCNAFLFIFYVLYVIYFIISSMQIREAWPEIDRDAVRRPSDMIAKGISKAFYAIPFAWELKEIASWIWTRTCLDLFQWLKFAEIHEKLFIVKCTAKSRRKIPVGKETSKLTKYLMGGGLLFGLVVLIIVPIFVFSNLNPMVAPNSITASSLSFTLHYAETKSFKLMEISDALIRSTTQSHKDISKLRRFTDIKGADTEQFQYVTYAKTSDENFFPTYDKISELSSYFTTSTSKPSVTLKYSFTRPEPSQKQNVELTFTQEVEKTNLANFRNLFDLDKLGSNKENKETIHFDKFFCKVIILTLESPPRPVERWEDYGDTQSSFNLTLRLKQFKGMDNEKILMLTAHNNLEGNGLFTISEKAKSSMFAGLSIITFYISVVLVVGKLIRSVFAGTYYKIIYEDMPNPSPLLKLCTGVELSRHHESLAREGELYYELIEMLRSTELLRLITKTSKEVYNFEKDEPNN